VELCLLCWGVSLLPPPHQLLNIWLSLAAVVVGTVVLVAAARVGYFTDQHQFLYQRHTP